MCEQADAVILRIEGLCKKGLSDFLEYRYYPDFHVVNSLVGLFPRLFFSCCIHTWGL